MNDKAGLSDPQEDCTLPPDYALPPNQLGRYSPERDFYGEKEIADYVEKQTRDEAVQHVERIKTEYVLGERYEIWDVSTNKNRWWVLTNLINLYSQRHFPSLDYTLSFHVGLMMRLASREHRHGEPEPTPFDEVFRRQNQAAATLERAVEAVDFQTVGMHLRECLISLVAAVRRRVELNIEGERPKDADVVGWSKLLLNHFCPGDKNDELRSYVRAVVEKSWPLVNWLTHHRNASKTAALIAADAVDAIVKHFSWLVSRERIDRKDTCPNCASRNIRTFFDRAVGTDGAYFEACAACNWESHPGYAE